MSTLDVAVAVPPNHFTPQKRKSTAASRALDSTTFLATPLLQADDVLAVSSDSDTLFPLLCSRIDMLHLSSEKLRTGLVDCQTILADFFQYPFEINFCSLVYVYFNNFSIVIKFDIVI